MLIWTWGVRIFNESDNEQFISSWNTISVHDYCNSFSERNWGTNHDSAAIQLDYINTEHQFSRPSPKIGIYVIIFSSHSVAWIITPFIVWISDSPIYRYINEIWRPHAASAWMFQHRWITLQLSYKLRLQIRNFNMCCSVGICNLWYVLLTSNLLLLKYLLMHLWVVLLTRRCADEHVTISMFNQWLYVKNVCTEVEKISIHTLPSE